MSLRQLCWQVLLREKRHDAACLCPFVLHRTAQPLMDSLCFCQRRMLEGVLVICLGGGGGGGGSDGSFTPRFGCKLHSRGPEGLKLAPEVWSQKSVCFEWNITSSHKAVRFLSIVWLIVLVRCTYIPHNKAVLLSSFVNFPTFYSKLILTLSVFPS